MTLILSKIPYQDGIISQQFDRKATMPPMPEDSPMVANFFRILDAFEEAVRSYGDCEIYADKIAKWSKAKFMTSFIDVAEPMRCGFQVLNHGDLWLNNMMFQSDEEGNPTEVSLLDYQMSFWASPTVDFLYFMMTSVADDIKVDHFDDFVEFYQNELAASLKKLNFDQHIPTLSEIQIDLLEKGYIGLLF